jgi:poly-D-alanine transfer protein DltD
VSAVDGGPATRESPLAPEEPWPGLLALALALVVAVGAGFGYYRWAVDWLTPHARALAVKPFLAKTQHLAFQEAALRDPRLLLVFGTSELYCCADGYNAPYLFWHEPQGFAVYAAGVPVTGDLFFAETFAALGHALAGKKVVLSDSPWYSNPQGVGRGAYDHTFSPEIAEAFAFTSPIPLSLREAIAQRMLAYPETLRRLPLLRAAIEDLAGGSAIDLLAYYALEPVGHLAAWIADLRGAYEAVRFVRDHPSLERPVPVRPHAIDWLGLLAAADRASRASTDNNPFGILRRDWTRCVDIEPGRPWCRRALRLYRSGRSNREGGVYPYPSGWVETTLGSPAWTDLRLALEVLREEHAQALAYLIPLQGRYDDYTDLSWPARRVLYLQYTAVAQQEGALVTTFSHHDEDPYFVDSFGHFNARGWVIVDYTLLLFWQGWLPALRPYLAAGGSGWPFTGGLVGCMLAGACPP